MLKGIDPILAPDVLYALCSMGHGDQVAVAEAEKDLAILDSK